MYKRSVTAAIVLASSTPFAQCLAENIQKGFVEGSHSSISSRTMYFNSDKRDGTDQVESATGLKLNFKSGFTEGAVGFGLDVQAMIGFHLDGGRGHHPNSNGFVPSDTDGSAVSNWSRLAGNAKAKFSKTDILAGNALTLDLPILSSSDSFLLPQSFQGAVLTTKELNNFTLTAGKLTKTIGRASSNYSGLSVSGGTEESDSFQFAGGDWKPTKNLKLRYYYANLENYYSQHFAGLTHMIPLEDGQSFQTDLRFFDSHSDGKNGQAGYRYNNSGGYAKHTGEVDNQTWSAAFTYALSGHAFTLGHQEVSDDGAAVWISNGSVLDDRGRNEGQGGAKSYLHTNAQLNFFARAGEKTTFGEYTYDFAASGVPGLKLHLSYLQGDDIKDVAGGSKHTEWERDVRLDYVIQSGFLKGLGTTIRQAVYRGDGSGLVGNTDEFRLIFNYTYAFN